MALYSFPSPFWALPNNLLSGRAAAASIALINSAGNLGGFVGLYVIGFLSVKTGSFTAGLSYLIVSAIASAFIVLSLRSLDGGVSDSIVRSPLPVERPVSR
jgi:ACS family tartrate transporter-like MFS transporter